MRFGWHMPVNILVQFCTSVKSVLKYMSSQYDEENKFTFFF